MSSDGETEGSGRFLIHEDIYHQRLVQLLGRMRSVLNLNTSKIHGRKTHASLISDKKAGEFLELNHLMGHGGGAFYYGLIRNEELVAVAAFSKPRFMKHETPTYYSTELVRYCSKIGTTVTGGLDKLIRHYIENHETDDLITYIDKEWSDGKSFVKLGFNIVDETAPILFAINSKTSERRKIDSKDKLRRDEYLVRNQGNLKLQLKTK